MSEIEKLTKQINYLWSTVKIMFVFILVLLIIGISNSKNSVDKFEIFTLNSRLDKVDTIIANHETNLKNLYRNDSLIVVNQSSMRSNQDNYQNQQQKKDLLSFLFKFL
jgi:DNA replication protein DnaD